jgi:hypothetical protein
MQNIFLVFREEGTYNVILKTDLLSGLDLLTVDFPRISVQMFVNKVNLSYLYWL